MTLEEIRKRIDEIDGKLLPLFLARMDCAREVAAVKKEAGLPVLNAGREQEILDRVASRAGEYGGAARVLYATLMEVSRGLQHQILHSGAALRAQIEAAQLPPAETGRVATFGRPGSFSNKAADVLFPGCTPVSFNSFAEIFRAVEPYPGRWTHHVMLNRPEDLDGAVRAWLAEAYDFSQAKRRKKKGTSGRLPPSKGEN